MLFTCYEYIIRNKQILTVSTGSTRKKRTCKTEKKNTNNNKKQNTFLLVMYSNSTRPSINVTKIFKKEPQVVKELY